MFQAPPAVSRGSNPRPPKGIGYAPLFILAHGFIGGSQEFRQLAGILWLFARYLFTYLLYLFA